MTDVYSELRYRQIHLDFHTGGQIPGVGDDFDRRQFQEMLRLGHVDGVTLFSKCHHGYSYHATAVGVRHPHLAPGLDLLGEQIAACRETGVTPVLYVSAGYDELARRAHPEWACRDRKGGMGDPLQPGFRRLCFSTGYLDYLCAQIEEVTERYGADAEGVFLDIIAARRCYCSRCLEVMTEHGLDPADESQADAFARTVARNYYERTTAACHANFPHLRVFHNGGHIGKGDDLPLTFNTHLEIESLPTGGWGYDHFPVSARWATTTGKDILGMTGKFHTHWGEFGGFKRPEALRYECAVMLAFGAKCSIGDQLHPSGIMDPDTYRLIGAAYAEVEAKEPWCRGARPVADVALVSTEAVRIHRGHALGGAGHGARHDEAQEGAARMLLEMHVPFDVIDPLSENIDFSLYQVLVLPDTVTLQGEDDPLTGRLRTYLAGGGRLLISGSSGMTTDGPRFLLDLGLVVDGRSAFDPDYLVPGDLSPSPVARGPFVIHGGAWQVRSEVDRTHSILAHRAEPYHNRTWDSFCSHLHTPYKPLDASPDLAPGVIAGEQFAYFAHDIFSAYRRYGQPLYRDLVKDALARLLSEPTLSVSGLPTAGRVALTLQEALGRSVLHLLYATPVKRGANASEWNTGYQSVEMIEDIVPIHNIGCAVVLPQRGAVASRVAVVPSGEELPFETVTSEKGAAPVVRFTVPEVWCHQMVEIYWK